MDWGKFIKDKSTKSINNYDIKKLYSRDAIVIHDYHYYKAIKSCMGAIPGKSDSWKIFTPVMPKEVKKQIIIQKVPETIKKEEPKEKIVEKVVIVEKIVEKIIKEPVRPSLDTFWMD